MSLSHSRSCRVVLGSGSPRRKEILQSLFHDFEIRKSSAEPEVLPGESALEYAKGCSKAKAEDLMAGLAEDELLLCFDTVVSLEGRVMTKPSTKQDWEEMLWSLSGTTHEVYTSYSFVFQGQSSHGCEETKVTFAKLDKSCIDWYLSTDDGLDKAGGYGIQSQGRLLVKEIQGCYYNVVGLPLHACYQELCKMGFTLQVDS